LVILANDFAAQLDALVADEDARPGHELSDFVPGLTAEVASLIDSRHAVSIGLQMAA
jgi:hypothetical protein